MLLSQGYASRADCGETAWKQKRETREHKARHVVPMKFPTWGVSRNGNPKRDFFFIYYFTEKQNYFMLLRGNSVSADSGVDCWTRGVLTNRSSLSHGAILVEEGPYNHDTVRWLLKACQIDGGLYRERVFQCRATSRCPESVLQNAHNYMAASVCHGLVVNLYPLMYI